VSLSFDLTQAVALQACRQWRLRPAGTMFAGSCWSSLLPMVLIVGCHWISVCAIRFDLDAGPVRRFPSFRGQRNFWGSWWFSKTSVHIGYESWLERDQVMAFDADPEVAGVASQPFRLHWSDGRHHVPDYFARKFDGSVVVVDVRADDQVSDADAELFARTGLACASLGWSYRRVGALDRVLAANLRWLSGYRHPRVLRAGLAAELLTVFATCRPLRAGAASIGSPAAVLPVLFHLLWRRRLTADLAGSLLGDQTSVVAAAA
jgi:hypothetical protein